MLVAFGKTGLLQPGETETLSFTLHAMDIASFDEASSSWIVEAGDYTIKSGASSRDFRETASFTVSQELMVEKVSKALTPEREIAVLRKQSPTE